MHEMTTTKRTAQTETNDYRKKVEEQQNSFQDNTNHTIPTTATASTQRQLTYNGDTAPITTPLTTTPLATTPLVTIPLTMTTLTTTPLMTTLLTTTPLKMTPLMMTPLMMTPLTMTPTTAKLNH
ncbi:hypothetical protein F8M41_001673 [Gigaspora margarita]|uniref:Uncharacterized protein n=1 Tax=Gigaspora margarita TaxID=4874 RepID=A0A8H3XES4_GIGMA|nr:hypothetical protein F8M41_001673 [Gigaspora margarita]